MSRLADMPALPDPVRSAVSARSKPSRLLDRGMSLVRSLLLDRQYFFHLTALLLVGETFLGLLIIHRVPCELSL